MAIQRVDNSVLWRIFFRSFLIQGSWSFRYMLAMGFCFSAIPVCRRLMHSKKDRENFIRRHLEFFNAHPYFASWCLGATAKLEEDALNKEFVDYKSISKFKERVGSATGALGDKLFWNLIKPISAGIGVSVAVLGSVLAVPIFLIIFNLCHILFRYFGVFRGYQKGFDIISDISMRRYSKIFKWLFRIGAVVAGIVIAAFAAWVVKGGAGIVAFNGSIVGLITFFVSIPLTLVLTRLRFSISSVLLLTICMAAVLGCFLI